MRVTKFLVAGLLSSNLVIAGSSAFAQGYSGEVGIEKEDINRYRQLARRWLLPRSLFIHEANCME